MYPCMESRPVRDKEVNQKGENMAKNINLKAICDFYNCCDEDTRLTRSRHGQLEYLTTMHYIQKHLKKGMKILEIGAGTGKYSITLAKMGYDVTAVELVKANLQILKQNAKGIKNIMALQGDALDLSMLENASFDMVLVLGPMYHLYNRADQTLAIKEALRVCKDGGVLMFAFIPIHNFIYGCGFDDGAPIADAINKNFDENYRPRQYPEQMFTGFEIADFKNLFKGLQFKGLHMVSADSIMDLEERIPGFNMTDEDFEAFAKYHLATCENPTLQGLAFHLLYIGKKA